MSRPVNQQDARHGRWFHAKRALIVPAGLRDSGRSGLGYRSASLEPRMAHAPIVDLPTHRVTNQPPPLLEYDLLAGDAAMQEAIVRDGAGWAEPALQRLARAAGSAAIIEAGFLANEHLPRLETFDRFGQRIDEVRFHPAYHELMALGMKHRIPSLPWSQPQPGAHVAHAAMGYLMSQAEAEIGRAHV